ncbi:MAG TPA: nuclear transport factor 2 family protein [Gemmatimonadales bacterium]|nr:nuclear transport factor 2 family protein [Gemmatimonadales bacterium]
MSRLAILTMLLGVTTACRRTVDVAVTRAALQDADRAFDRATSERRLEGWVEYFAEDGAMLRPGGAVTGRAAIREHMSPVLRDSSFTLRWQPTRSDVGAAGDLGYTVGRYEARRRDVKGAANVRTGTYLTIWKKQADGSWKVVLDTGVEDPPTEVAAAR